jgi:hypothetical protein
MATMYNELVDPWADSTASDMTVSRRRDNYESSQADKDVVDGGRLKVKKAVIRYVLKDPATS